LRTRRARCDIRIAAEWAEDAGVTAAAVRISKHLDLAARHGVEQSVIGGALRLLGFQRGIGAQGQTLRRGDRRDAGNQRLTISVLERSADNLNRGIPGRADL
jgi:hypothetical protein